MVVLFQIDDPAGLLLVIIHIHIDAALADVRIDFPNFLTELLL